MSHTTKRLKGTPFHRKGIMAVAAAIFCIATPAWGATYQEVLRKIVSLNPAMRVAQSVTEAAADENHTGLNLANPELELSYQWGSPAGVPDKKTIDVTQAFDFATLSGGKRRVAKARDSESRVQLEGVRRQLEAETDLAMTETVYRRRLAAQYDTALHLCRQLLEMSRKGMEQGLFTIVDVTTSQLELGNLETEASLNAIELRALETRLANLAGGEPPAWDASRYMDYTLPSDLKTWLDTNAHDAPAVAAARAATGVADTEISLRKSEGLPSFSLGYTSELVKDANYHGVSLGVELPLWANSGRVKAARAAHRAASLAEETARLEFDLHQTALWQRAESLGRMASQAAALRADCPRAEALQLLYQRGNISVHDYLSQLMPLVELDRRVAEAEFEYQKALAEFRALL